LTAERFEGSSDVPLVECVPNFSEGRDMSVIDQILDEITAVENVQLLHVDAGHAVNRTVVTFAGSPEGVLDAAFRAFACAVRLIDMRQQRGTHPRQGAVDVCPFVPLQGISMMDCVSLSRQLAQRVGTELTIPVYLYGEAARRPSRRELAAVRSSGYESLAERMAAPGGEPDYGPRRFVDASGATAIGARPILIAYNVNLATRNARTAKQIARAIRERRACARLVESGCRPSTAGYALPECRARGWFIDEYGCAQVTMNLLDYRVTGMHQAFERVRLLAQNVGVDVTGSEVVGLVPLRALIDVADYYSSVPDEGSVDRVDVPVSRAVDALGLADVRPFDPTARILDFVVAARLGEYLRRVEPTKERCS